MKLKSLQANCTHLTLNNGTEVLFSYETPVAARLMTGEVVKTEKKWSNTTTRHINKHMPTAQTVPQETLDNLVN